MGQRIDYSALVFSLNSIWRADQRWWLDIALSLTHYTRVTGLKTTSYFIVRYTTTAIDFYQQVPALLSGSTYIPDFSYALFIDSNAVVNLQVIVIFHF